MAGNETIWSSNRRTDTEIDKTTMEVIKHELRRALHIDCCHFGLTPFLGNAIGFDGDGGRGRDYIAMIRLFP